MNLEALFFPKKREIIQKWIDLVLDSYGSPEFFKKKKDRFANPVGATVSDGLHELYKILFEDGDLQSAAKPLENIIKIRAVQDFRPSQAVAFTYHLKRIVRDEISREKNREDLMAALPVLDARIDSLALMAFDFYMDCRERLHQIRLREVMSGRSALTDGTKCFSAMLKQNQAESADNNQNNRLT